MHDRINFCRRLQVVLDCAVVSNPQVTFRLELLRLLALLLIERCRLKPVTLIGEAASTAASVWRVLTNWPAFPDPLQTYSVWAHNLPTPNFTPCLINWLVAHNFGALIRFRRPPIPKAILTSALKASLPVSHSAPCCRSGPRKKGHIRIVRKGKQLRQVMLCIFRLGCCVCWGQVRS